MKKSIIIGLLTCGIIFSFWTFSKNTNVDSNIMKLQQDNYKYIYLTFDDGPLNGSQRIDDVILIEKLPVTVMLVGEHALAKPQYLELYRENEYIEIGNHSYSHANNHYQLYYSNPAGVLKDFIRNMNTLKLTNKIGRLPGRNMWRVNGRSRNDISSGIEAADLLSKNGFALFGWDLEWMHDSHTAEPIGTAEDIFKEIEERLSDDRVFTNSHIVLLCHDEMFQHTYEESELKKLIDLLNSKSDYKLSHLKDYP